MLAATLITYTGRRGSRSARLLVIGSGLLLDRLALAVAGLRSLRGRLDLIEAPRRLARAFDRRADPDLARLDGLGLRDSKRQHAVLEGRGGLVGLETRWQGHGPGQRTAAELRQG